MSQPGMFPIHPVQVLEQDSVPDSFPPLGGNVKVLMVWPRFPLSFWGFGGLLELIPEGAIAPPLGLITVAALCPAAWTIRLIDRAFEELTDEDLLWADLVMVSAMAEQRFDALEVLTRARSLGRRTFLGGPWASREPESVLLHADHVLAGEAEDIFAAIARELEQGTARKLYRVADKPDVTTSPIPRFDLLRLDKYVQMSVQFSRGCPFQCEFCDIITIYGRRPRTKTPAQVIAELKVLRELGWRNEVFIVDDNFIGNSRKAMELMRELTVWQKTLDRPYALNTQASIDLADRPDVLAAMVEANFIYVFVGIETPSAEALKESRKFQNLRSDNIQQVRVIQESGLWVLAGFIVGFDSDDESIFERQLEFIERTAIPWALVGALEAPPTTALFERLKKASRLLPERQVPSNFSVPNFETVMPLPALLRGLSGLLLRLYQADAYFDRSLRSLERWRPIARQRPLATPFLYTLRAWVQSIWKQGMCSSYRSAYWKFMWRLLSRWARHPAKIELGLMMGLAAHHFVNYAREVAGEFERECERLEAAKLPSREADLAEATSV